MVRKVLKTGIKKPKFRRQEFQKKRLKEVWRRPSGISSKLRLGKKSKGYLVKIGYKQPEKLRNIHPCGLREVLIKNMSDLERIDTKKECGRVAAQIGTKKKIVIIEAAKKAGIKILNPRIKKRIKKVSEKK